MQQMIRVLEGGVSATIKPDVLLLQELQSTGMEDIMDYLHQHYECVSFAAFEDGYGADYITEKEW